MRSMKRSILLACALTLGANPARAEPAPARAGAIAVEMSGFRSDKGAALVALFASSKGFPDEPEKAALRMKVPIRGGKARALFRGVRPGTYAVAVLHDENGDRKMKTNLVGIPKEGYGASRDARGNFGPPRFDDARLALRAGQTLRAPIKLVYH
jgi:uncharacterized protein (DUF2141 family)